MTALYDDGRVACDDEGVSIRWYYLWGTKNIPYTDIRTVYRRAMSRWGGKWRLWGSGDFVHWYNLDPRRPRKETAIELDVGGRIRPTITPDDPDVVVRIINQHRHT